MALPGPPAYACTEGRAKSSISPARVAANRANSQLSTGPKTPDGKAKSSLNAVKNALTGRTVLLPSNDAALYERHVARFFSQFNPVGEGETELVQSLADTQWRLNRIPSLEMGIYAVARLNFKDMFKEEEPDIREALIQAHTFITHQKQLNNLSIQETRLRRHYQKDLAELQELQQPRLKGSEPLTRSPERSDGSEIGFVFSPAVPCPQSLTRSPERSDGCILPESPTLSHASANGQRRVSHSSNETLAPAA